MLFQNAIEIKELVNQLNQERKRDGFAVIVFKCEMFALGKWSIDLSLERRGVFFSKEMAQLSSLHKFLGFSFWICSNNVGPVIYLQ